MSEPVFRLTLECGTNGTYLAWVDDLPGCAVRAATRQEALERAPDAIREFLAWSGAEAPAGLRVEIGAEVESRIEADEDTEALLAVDRRPLAARDWAELEDRLTRSRRELLRLLERVTEEDLEVRGTGERSVREELEHVGFVELMYAAWTFDLARPEGLREFLDWTRGIAAARMRALADREADALTFAHWAGAPRPEEWTPRKAARRLLWHERLHLRPLERLAARET